MNGLRGKEFLNSILDEQEQTYIKEFCQNERMVEAIRKVMLAGLYEQGVLKKHKKADSLSNIALALVANRGDISNEQLGEDLRAFWQGLNYLELAFENIKAYKEPIKVGEKSNQAR